MATATDRLEIAWSSPSTVVGWLSTLNHRSIGARFIATAFVFFLTGGLLALAMRMQLIGPNNDFLTAEQYNQFFTMHGTTMMFLFAVPMAEGFAMYLLPLLLGTRDLPFPRLNALGYYSYLFGGVFLYLSFVTGDVPDGGWFAYTPLTGSEFSPGVNLDFWLLGITFVEISAIAAAIEIIVLILKFRAPGMTLSRLPLFGWNMLAVAFAILFAFPPLIAASLLLEADRAIGTHIYNVAEGGDPLVWQHLFWIFGHPEVYIIFLPAAGFVSMIVPVFSRRPMVGYIFVALAAITTAFLSFGLWVHHMFATGLPRLALTFFTAASLSIAIPSGVQVFAWIATIWAGRPVFKTPLLFILGFLVIFLIGGITGVMVAIVPFDLQVHDSFFVVAHFHYVLIGGMVFPLFGALYYWLPKITGRMLNEAMGQLNFWSFFIGFNLTFFPMHITGLVGMPRRVYTYDEADGWGDLNLLSTIGAAILAGSVLIFIWNFLESLIRGEKAPDNPWDANTLEWATTSPPQPYNFRRLPLVQSRDPLWDQDDVFEPPGAEAAVEVDISQAPEGSRQTLMTTSLMAYPERIITIPALSIWPLIISLGLAAVFGGVLLEVYGLSIAGAMVAALGTALWHWPIVPAETAGPPGTLHQEVLRDSGQSITSESGWWGMGLLLAGGAAFMGSVYFAYFVIWARAEEWPLEGIDRPGFAFVPLLSLVLLAGVGLALLARHLFGKHSLGAIQLTSAGGIVLGAAYLILAAFELSRQDFEATTNAYGSLFFATHVFQATFVAVAMTLNVWVLIRTVERGLFWFHRVSVENALLAWGFAALLWAATFFVLYLVPYLGTPEGVRL